MSGAVHLAKRFFGSIRPGPPAADDEAWALSQLLPREQAVWRRMGNPDRRHAVAVARAVVARLEDEAGPPLDRPVVAAALLHDSGKVESGLRTPARVLATIVWAVLDDRVADRWSATASDAGLKARLARYRRHPELGADLLRSAGSAPLTVEWAAQHHRPEADWSVPLELGRVLKACDDD